MIQEFERLKKNEAYQNQIEWHANRMLSKVNYLIHTDSIKKNIIPNLSDKQKNFIYEEEADVLNVALFGMTAKEWREKHPDLAKTGNIRDNTDLLHLIILSNLETKNADLIANGILPKERLIILNQSAKDQVELLKNNKNIKELESLQNDINKKVLTNGNKEENKYE